MSTYKIITQLRNVSQIDPLTLQESDIERWGSVNQISPSIRYQNAHLKTPVTVIQEAQQQVTYPRDSYVRVYDSSEYGNTIQLISTWPIGPRRG